MELKFNPRDYQQKAINSVLRIFEGEHTNNQRFDISKSKYSSYNFTNELNISENKILNNLQAIQFENNRKEAPINTSEYLKNLDFTIEMETGTGKTFVYLKTIMELANKYDWTKFIIVVPSVAIREGVLSELERLKTELEATYKRFITSFEYSSKNINDLEDFNRSSNLQIMIMTMQSFNKDNNVLNKQNDDLESGKLIKLIEEVKPIVILDEPQNMGGEATSSKLKEFNPLFTLRYSATHKDIVNLIYRYTPIDAYNDNYVKKIEVLSVYGNPELDIKAYVEVEEIGNDKKGNIYTKIKFYRNEGTHTKIVSRKISNKGYNLLTESNGMIEYEGYNIKEVNVEKKFVRFENGIEIKEKDSSQNKDFAMKAQIRETIEEHLEKEKILNEKGIKVLSLFFIDKVSNFRDKNSSDGKGKILKWFKEEYLNAIKDKNYEYKYSDSIYRAYFAEDKDGIKNTKGNSMADIDTYEVIMKNKEKLLSFDEPARFIFTHSALREGWDNPNVFQICTLNETKTEQRKRQEIGRGLRLSVNNNGDRIVDPEINVLTVIANESYETFAKQLQNEINLETGISTGESLAKNGRDKINVKLNKKAIENENFKKLWSKINKITNYHIKLNTQEILRNIVKIIKSRGFIIETPKLDISKYSIDKIEDLDENSRNIMNKKGERINFSRIPNVIKRISDKTNLTKKTITQIIIESNIEQQIFNNPEEFIDKLSNIINNELHIMQSNNIQYSKTGEEYDISSFKEDVKVYKNHKHTKTGLNTNRTLYEALSLDSETELNILKDFNINEANIKFFLKLPNWFKIPTPIGTYNPDWALAFETEKNGDKLYLIRESKNTSENYFNENNLRNDEQQKIEFGKKHFDAIDVDYQVIEESADLFKEKRGVYNFENSQIEENELPHDVIQVLKLLKNKGIYYEEAKLIRKNDFEKFNISEDYYNNI